MKPKHIVGGNYMKKKFFSIAILMIFSTLILSDSLLAEEEKNTDITIISVQEANKLIEENIENTKFMILDVRTGEEYKAGHIENSINIDYKSPKFKENVSNLDKEKIYLTYCRSGRRSANSAEIMEELGFENIYMIEGGILAWDKAGLPIKK